MTKMARVVHETRRLSPEAPSCDVYMPADKGLAAARQQDGSFFISPGLGSVKADYGRLARELAGKGFTVFSPNCNERLPDGITTGALDRRAETLVRTIGQWAGHGVRILPHSLGGPVTIKSVQEHGLIETMAEEGSGPLLSISFMQPAGFEKHGPMDLVRSARFWFGEAVPRTGRLLPSLVTNPRSVYERLDAGQRGREIRELWDLPESFMVEGVKDLNESGVPMNFFVGPKDHLTRAKPIREAVEPIVGADNVIEVHPEAGHIPAQSHPRQMARVLLANLPSAVDSSVLSQVA